MKNPIEQQILAVLKQPLRQGNPYRKIEQLMDELLGGQKPGEFYRQHYSGSFREDIVVSSTTGVPIVIELKIYDVDSFRINIRNAVAGLLSIAAQARSSLGSKFIMSAVILISNFENRAVRYDFQEAMRSMVDQLFRSNTDDNRYDSVLFGVTDGQLEWHYFNRGRASDEPNVVLMLSTSEMVKLFLEQEIGSLSRPDGEPIGSVSRALLVADEWRSSHGGISTFNRELAMALASVGVEATVMLPHASEEDIKEASEVSVAVVSPARIPGLNDRENLILRPIFAEENWEPDFIVGHGRLLGPYAFAQQQQYFSNARRVHFVHTDAEQLEAAKEEPGGRSHMINADSRRSLERDLARSADLVIGVGPLLTETMRDELIGVDRSSKVSCFLPGLRETFDVTTASSPVKNHILIVGRADDFTSKGIDIAAEALLRIIDRWPPGRPHPPVLVIRGVPEEGATHVKKQLDEILEGRVDYRLRPYSDSEIEVSQDLAQARVLLMPSRHEGFGLAAYEAIASGVPVIISQESGLAQFLRNSNIDTSPSSIVTTRNTSRNLAIDQWAVAIQHVLDHSDDARKQAIKLRSAITDVVNWEKSVQEMLTIIGALS